MSDEKKNVKGNEELKDKELNLEDLDKVSGGSLGNVRYTDTVDISDDTKGKI